jgi:hypothetical protein
MSRWGGKKNGNGGSQKNAQDIVEQKKATGGETMIDCEGVSEFAD